VRVLAGPRDLTPLDLLTPQLAESLVSGLRRDFALTILDLPSVWTPWTYRALQLADRIVLVTHLSVPHVHLLRRQMSVLLLQRLDQVPLTLVCNAVTADQQSLLSLKTAERSIGRPFDIVVPEDSRVMGAATNEGVRISAIRRGTKLEKAIGLVAEAIAADALADASQTLRA
jgi:pilus assembly protein CpaE